MIFTVAIDGPAASGKGTIARRLARRFGFAHLDTGLLYRATGRRVLDGADPVEAAASLSEDDLQGPGLRAEAVGQEASRVAAMAEVRAALVDVQRRFARREGGAVLDGRDIGTVICPEAELKLFVTASDAVRARRRHAELEAAGDGMALDDVARDLALRDARDAARSDAPLRAASDAVMLDTTHMDIDAALDFAARKLARRLPDDAAGPRAGVL